MGATMAYNTAAVAAGRARLPLRIERYFGSVSLIDAGFHTAIFHAPIVFPTGIYLE